MKNFDLIVVGGGPGGYEAAIRGAQLGKKVALIEQNKIGGTCLNRGCIPTKVLLHTAEVFHEAHTANELGLSFGELKYDMNAIHARKADVCATLRTGVEGLLKANGVEVINARGVVKADGIVMAGEEEIKGEKILLATGSKPSRPPIPGLELEGVVTSDEILEGEPIDYKSLTIIGGGVIGVELAGFYAALGCKVTIVEALERLVPTLDREISQSLAMIFKKRGIEVNCSSMVSEIVKGENGLVTKFATKGAEKEVESEGVLVCIGRRPCTENLFDGVTPEMNRGFLVVNDKFETTVPNVYAIGDVIGGIQLAHKASAEGLAAVEMMCGNENHTDLSLVPSCLYTSPEVACVGITADQAKADGIAVKTAKYVMSGNGKSIITREERGFIKVVFDAET
ncbi:MAG: dihydrolipoyl dehydrogenase, partial [Clostridia bacterium]|nr:dihydrolipoyl dehydrogenase [Clostridia bacterium]